MTDFTATHFRFEVEALTTLSLDEYTGSTLRGALVQALQNSFCPARNLADVEHQAICPVCWLLSHESSPGDSRRPYAIEPLLGDRRTFDPGERFQFGLTLFGRAVNLFPYLVLAIPQMGRTGMGHKLDDGRGRGRRGQFVLRQIEEVNPITQTHSTLMGESQQMVQTPSSLVTETQVGELSSQLAQRLAMQEGRLGIYFLTPTRIIYDKQLVHRPHFRPLLQRLVERVYELQRTFGNDKGEPPAWNDLLALADQVDLIEDATYWWDLRGHSSRLGRAQEIGGYIGEAWYQAEAAIWDPLLPWLVWGMSTHVGKNAVKGSGWYTVDAATVA